MLFLIYTTGHIQPVGVFSTKEKAARYAITKKLNCFIMQVEVDTPVIEWVVKKLPAEAKSPDVDDPDVISRFGSPWPLVVEIGNTGENGEQSVIDRTDEHGGRFSLLEYESILNG